MKRVLGPSPKDDAAQGQDASTESSRTSPVPSQPLAQGQEERRRRPPGRSVLPHEFMEMFAPSRKVGGVTGMRSQAVLYIGGLVDRSVS